MKLWRSVLFSLVLIAVMSVQTAFALELVYPEDGVYVVRSNFLIIRGGETPQLDGIIIEINGLKSEMIDISSQEYRSYFSDFVILLPEYEPGESVIRVEGYSGEKLVGEVSARIYFLENAMEVPPEGFRPFAMHSPEKEALCVSCHNMSPTPEQLKLSSVDQNPCASCHKSMLKKERVHGPAGVFRCVFCHDSQSKPVKYANSGGDAEVCNQCHLDKVRAFETNKFVHGPVAVGMCSICHDAHATDYPAQLFGEINDVCLSCHAGLDVPMHFSRGVGSGHPVEGFPDPQDTTRKLSCVSCHNPHGGMTRTFFEENITSSMMLCRNCHFK